MKNYLDLVGVVVAFVAFFVLFFGFVTIPVGASVPAAVLAVGFAAVGIGFITQLVADNFS